MPTPIPDSIALVSPRDADPFRPVVGRGIDPRTSRFSGARSTN